MKGSQLLWIFLFFCLSNSFSFQAFADEIYQVRKGDNLYKISKRFKVPIDKIRETNGLQSASLKPGMRLTIPSERSQTAAVSSAKGKRAPAITDSSPTREKRPVTVSAPSPATQTEAQSDQPSYHIVRKGDTLSSIARRYGVSIKDLQELNHLGKKARLKVNMRLVVRQEMPRTYVVKPGDTLSKIAKRFGLSQEFLIDLNELDPDDLKPGQEILLRAEEDEGNITSVPTAVSEEKILEELQEMAKAEGEGQESPGIKEQLLRIAKKMLDIPYMFGGTSFWGMDCSAYVQKVFGFFNVSLPRTAREQFRVGERVKKENLSIGDLVFFRTYATFPSHVGIYLGQDQFIHASSFAKRVKIDRLDKPYFMRRFIGARRIPLEQEKQTN